MSNLTAIGMISAIFISAFFVLNRADNYVRDLRDDIVTGVVRGVPISMKNRRVLLFQHWMPNVSGQILLSLVLALANIGIARNVDDEFVQGLAYVCAIGGSFAVVFSLILGSWYFLYLASVLRQADSD